MLDDFRSLMKADEGAFKRIRDKIDSEKCLYLNAGADISELKIDVT